MLAADDEKAAVFLFGAVSSLLSLISDSIFFMVEDGFFSETQVGSEPLVIVDDGALSSPLFLLCFSGLSLAVL